MLAHGLRHLDAVSSPPRERGIKWRAHIPSLLVVGMCAGILPGSFASHVELQLDPVSTTLAPGMQSQFVAREPHSQAPVSAQWSVHALPNISVGHIDQGGQYTAATRVPPSETVRVYGRSPTSNASAAATLRIHSPTADGSFVEAMSLPAYGDSHGGATMVADIDGDGYDDVLTFGGRVSAQGLRFERGQRDGTFTLAHQDASYILPESWAKFRDVILTELDGDGILDAIGLMDIVRGSAAQYPLDPDHIYTYHGRGDGTFDLINIQNQVVNGGSLFSPLVADFDKDGDNDFAVVDRSIGWIRVGLNDGTGQFTQGGTYATDTPVPLSAYLLAEDVNSDGELDLIAVNVGSNLSGYSASIKVYLNDGFGSFSGLPIYEPWSNSTQAMLVFKRPHLADINGDNIPDLLLNAGDDVHYFSAVGDGSFDPPTALGVSNTTLLNVVNSDGDAFPDLLMQGIRPGLNGTRYVLERWVGDGQGGFLYQTDLFATGQPIQEVHATELNGDDKYDLVVRWKNGQREALGTLLGGPGVAAPLPSLTLMPGAQQVFNVGEPDYHVVDIDVTVTGSLSPQLVWTVNGVAGGNADVGTVTVVDDFKVRYTPPLDTALDEVQIEVTDLTGTLMASTTVSLTHYRWYPLSDPLQTPANIRKLVWAGDGSRLYAATTTQVYVSSDDGVSWVAASGSGAGALPGADIETLLVDPMNPDRLFVGLNRTVINNQFIGGIYRSEDGGASWAPYNDGLPSNGYVRVRHMALSPIDGGGVLSAGVYLSRSSVANGVYQRAAGSTSWSHLQLRTINQFNGEDVWHIEADPNNPLGLYVVSRTIFDLGGGTVVYDPLTLYQSHDGGQSWTNLNNGFQGAKPDLTFAPTYIAIDPYDSQHLLTTGTFAEIPGWGIMESRDGGSSWQETALDVGAQGYPIEFSPVEQGTVLTRDIYVTTGLHATHWHRIRAGLMQGVTPLTASAIAIAPPGAASPAAFYAATSAGIYSTISAASLLVVPVTPAHTSLYPGEVSAFSTTETVTWSLQGIPGIDLGIINTSGSYTPPLSRLPPTGDVRVYATSQSSGNRGAATVRLSSATADGTFVEVASLPAYGSAQAGASVVGDVDGDGIDDVLTFGTRISGQGVRFERGQGDGTFVAVLNDPIYVLPESWAKFKDAKLVELDGDGIPDLIGLMDEDRSDSRYPFDIDRVYSYRGRGDGTFDLISKQNLILKSTSLVSPLIADLDKDGDMDMVVVDRAAQHIKVGLNDGSGEFASGAVYATEGPFHTHLTVGDVNHDGDLDLVAVNVGSNLTGENATIKAYLNDGFGGFAGEPLFAPWATDPNTVLVHGQPHLTDVDGDETLDLLFSAGSDVYVLGGRGDGRFSAPQALGASDGLLIGSADINGDKATEILVRAVRVASSGVRYVLEAWGSDGQGGYSHGGDIWSNDEEILWARETELNGDDKYDLVVGWKNSQREALGTLLGGPGVAAPLPSLTLIPGAQQVFNVGEPDNQVVDIDVTVTGSLSPQLVWTVNGIAGGNADVGTVTVVDDFKVRYTPPPDTALDEVQIEVTDLTGTLMASTTVTLSHYRWYPLSDPVQTPANIRKLEWAADGSRLYAATTTQVYVSTDDGASWVDASGSGAGALPGADIETLLVDPDDAHTVYVGVRLFQTADSLAAGVYKTQDGGQSWRQISNGMPAGHFNGSCCIAMPRSVSDLAISAPHADGHRTLYAAVTAAQSNQNGVYRSEDGGNSWTQELFNRFFSSQKVWSLAAARNDPAVLYVVSQRFDTFNGVTTYFDAHLYRSTDNGVSLIDLQTQLNDVKGHEFLPTFVAIDPHDSNHVLVVGTFVGLAGWGIMESHDGGSSWQETALDVGAQGYPIEFSPVEQGTVLTRDIYVTTGLHATHWHRIRAGLAQGATPLIASAIAIAPAGATSPGTFYAATSAGIFATNQPPTAVDDRAQVLEDKLVEIDILANDLDVDSNTLTPEITVTPSHGSVQVTGENTVIYQPQANYYGNDGFSYRVYDGLAYSQPAQVNIDIIAVNDAPTATADSYSVNEDTTLAVAPAGILLNDTDIEGDSLSSILVQDVAHGSLDLKADGAFSYTPDANYCGLDSFRYAAQDSDGASATAAVEIDITCVNDVPQVNAGPSQEVNEGEVVIFGGSFVDPDSGDFHEFSWDFGDGSSVVGTLTPSHVYADNGLYTAVLSVTDNSGATTTSPVIVTVTNVAPLVIVGPQRAINEGEVIDLSSQGITISDPGFDSNGGGTLEDFNVEVDWGDGVIDDSASSTVALIESPGSPGNPTTIAVQAQHYYADDGIYQVRLSVSDDDGGSSSASFIVTVSNVAPIVDAGPDRHINEGEVIHLESQGISLLNIPPAANGALFADQGYDFAPANTQEDFTVEVDWGDGVIESDADGVTIIEQPGNGGVPTIGTIQAQHAYTNEGDYLVTIKVTDDNYGSGDDQFLVTVANLAPTAQHQQLLIPEDSVVDITLTATDPGADLLTYQLLSQPLHGVVTGSAPNLRYRPNSDYHGPDAFQFLANDSLLDSNIATVSIEIEPLNDAPALLPIGNQAVNENQLLSIHLTATDVDGDALSYSVANLPPGAVFDSATNTINYRADFSVSSNSVDQFFDVLVQVSDGAGGLDSETVRITVLNVNRAPHADAGPDQQVEAGSLVGTSVLLNGSASQDPDGDSLSYLWSGPFGQISGPAPTVLVPLGSSDITLTVTDSGGAGNSDVMTVTVADHTAPALANMPASITALATSSAGAVVSYSLPTATDTVDPNPSVLCSPGSGSQFPLGTSAVECHATDHAGNTATDSFAVTVHFQLGQFLAPLREGGVYKLGRTLPIKFTLNYADGTPVTDANASLTLQQLVSGEVNGDPVIVESNSSADSGNTFRYSGDHYIYNLDTRALSAGSYLVAVDLHDGLPPRTITIAFK